MTASNTYDVIILGAGAAGLMCAAQATQRGRKVAVLEHQDTVGKKILISGGGRCNFTNLHCRPENFLSENPHFAKSALARYTPADFIALVDKHRISYHEKKLGQLFCDRSAQDIVNLLRHECKPASILVNCRVLGVRQSTGFLVETSLGPFVSRALVVATGGLSIPKIGATSFGYDLARQFALKIIPCRPALVPLVFSESERNSWSSLAGVAAECEAEFGRQRFHERLLFTHRGLSGPVILQISSYWNGREPIKIDLLPGMPRRLADRFPIPESHRDWQVLPAGTEGYAKAEVTAGGVDTDELSSKTMESRRIPGLYFIGEVVDVTGHLGGFNFQWAWASGYAAGQAV